MKYIHTTHRARRYRGCRVRHPTPRSPTLASRRRVHFLSRPSACPSFKRPTDRPTGRSDTHPRARRRPVPSRPVPRERRSSGRSDRSMDRSTRRDSRHTPRRRPTTARDRDRPTDRPIARGLGLVCVCARCRRRARERDDEDSTTRTRRRDERGRRGKEERSIARLSVHRLHRSSRDANATHIHPSVVGSESAR